MIQEIASSYLLGMPLFLLAGVMTMLLMIVTMALGMLVIRGKAQFRHHKILAYATLASGAVHGILVMSVFVFTF